MDIKPVREMEILAAVEVDLPHILSLIGFKVEIE